MDKTSRNSRLKMHLAELRARATLAKSDADIKKAADIVKNFAVQTQYRFNHTWSYIAAVLGVVMFSLGTWAQLELNQSDKLWVQAGGVVLVVASLAVIFLRYKAIKDTGDALYVRAAAIQAGIERDYEFNAKEYWQQLASLFSLFNVGDEGQSITKRYLGGVDSTPFTLFEFKYVNVTRSTSTDSNGNTRTTTSKQTHYKYGMIVQFEDFSYLSLNVRGLPEKWDSSSRRFNKLFKVRCASAMKAAKFFDPKTVLAFEDQFSFVKSLDVTSQSVVCIELPKEVFPTRMATPNLHKTDAYIKHLLAPAELPLLNGARDLIHCINEQK
jgi:hypothetical protein